MRAITFMATAKCLLFASMSKLDHLLFWIVAILLLATPIRELISIHDRHMWLQIALLVGLQAVLVLCAWAGYKWAYWIVVGILGLAAVARSLLLVRSGLQPPALAAVGCYFLGFVLATLLPNVRRFVRAQEQRAKKQAGERERPE